MENKNLMIEINEAKASVMANYPNDPLLKHIITEALDKLPKVEAAPVVHGRWENGDCSACGFDIRDLIDADSDFRGWVWEGLPYCPDCGAKMDLKGE